MIRPSYDVVVVGAGIAGLSAAAELARDGTVLLCEAEPVAERHATGRSAAAYLASYGNATVRGLTASGKPWFESRGDGWSDVALLAPRPAIWICRPEAVAVCRSVEADIRGTGCEVRRLDEVQARELCPAIRPEWCGHALADPDAADVDVAAAMAALRRAFAAWGGTTRLGAPVRSLRRDGAGWAVEVPDGPVHCATVVNAAGAWADAVAQLAGVNPVGLQPMRRTVAVTPVPDGRDVWSWPLVMDVEESFYFKPERGALLVSPADETPMPAGDARPEEIDIARALDAANAATDLGLRSVRRSWAGLRTFAPDRTPVVGPDPAEPSFVWAAGQGGYGITTSPSIAVLVAAAVRGDAVPADLSPARLRG
jgi:D-arginine dehydrogenase